MTKSEEERLIKTHKKFKDGGVGIMMKRKK